MSVEEIDPRYEELDLKTEDFELILEGDTYSLYRPKPESTENTEGEFFILDSWRKGVIEIRKYYLEEFIKAVNKIIDTFDFEEQTFYESNEGKKFMEKLRKMNTKGTKENEEWNQFVKKVTNEEKGKNNVPQTSKKKWNTNNRNRG